MFHTEQENAFVGQQTLFFLTGLRSTNPEYVGDGRRGVREVVNDDSLHQPLRVVECPAERRNATNTHHDTLKAAFTQDASHLGSTDVEPMDVPESDH